MRYTVLWLPSVLQDLAELWNQASDRAALTNAANAIDAALERDPLNQGESREGSKRIWFKEPLAIFFEVDHQQRQVTVYAVWCYPA